MLLTLLLGSLGENAKRDLIRSLCLASLAASLRPITHPARGLRWCARQSVEANGESAERLKHPPTLNELVVPDCCDLITTALSLARPQSQCADEGEGAKFVPPFSRPGHERAGARER